jgi:uncharacterized protein (TIGR03089 family)
MTTFDAVLTSALKADPSRPLVTFYDDVTGERVELSRVTYANWVAKAASLLVDEHDLTRGDPLRLDLPPHWLGPVFLGAAWTAGLVVSDTDEPAAVVCGPDSVRRWAARAADIPVLACSLLPLGVRFADPLPVGVHDVGVEIWSQPDAFVPYDPPGDRDPAYDLAGEQRSHDELWSAAAVGDLVADGGRLFTEANPTSPSGIATFAEPLARSGSLILVAQADRERLEATYVAERATARFPA